jgi:ribosomal protein S18 acetylase RimI-like enzyme
LTARAAKQILSVRPDRRTVTVRRLEDRAAVRERLSLNKPYAAFALAYLEARRFAMAEFYEIEHNGRQALLFHGRGLPGSSSQLFGDPRLLPALLRLHPGPRSTLLTCEPEQTETALATYHLWHPQSMQRLVLDAKAFTLPEKVPNLRRLTASDAYELNRLYALEGDGIWYTGRQIQEGLYYGVQHHGRLIAAAGTHIHSATESVGVVGNVFTHPDFRGHGLGTAVTAAVADKLLERCDLIVLSVDPANRSARHIYENLGFREAGRLVEAMATRKEAMSPLPIVRRLIARYRGSPGSEVVEL